nr:hypothetical protein [Tanacetum cinerariifolium]
MTTANQGMSVEEIEQIVTHRVVNAIEEIAIYETKTSMACESMSQTKRQGDKVVENLATRRSGKVAVRVSVSRFLCLLFIDDITFPSGKRLCMIDGGWVMYAGFRLVMQRSTRRIIDMINVTNEIARAFDVTTKGILHYRYSWIFESWHKTYLRALMHSLYNLEKLPIVIRRLQTTEAGEGVSGMSTCSLSHCSGVPGRGTWYEYTSIKSLLGCSKKGHLKKFPLLVRKVPPAEDKRCHCQEDCTAIEDMGESWLKTHLYHSKTCDSYTIIQGKCPMIAHRF